MKQKIAIIDYGMGNLRSVQKAFEAQGHVAKLTTEAADVAAAARVVFPGVGAFADCMDNLAARGLDEALRAVVAEGRPLLGICLGLQALFEESDEFGRTAGLGARANDRRQPSCARRVDPGSSRGDRVRG